jgi:TRAP-type mannitol/chloroaromatic compound transport system substrate-binding protein
MPGFGKLALFTAIGSIAVTISAHSAQAQQDVYRYTFQSAYSASDPQYIHFARWAERIAEYSGGRLVIDTQPAGTIVDAFEVLDATSDGIIDGAHSWSGFWIGKDRASVMVSSGPAGPFGMEWSDMWGWYYHGGGLEEVNWFFHEHLGMNVVWRPLLSSGAQPLGWFNTVLESADDLRGLTLRIPGIPGEMYEGMGVSVVTLPGGEIVPAGDRGVIDAAEFVGPYIDYQLGFHDVWRYFYSPAYHETVTVAEVLIGQHVWDELPDELRGILELVTRVSMLEWEQHQQYEDKRHMDMLQEAGVEFRRTPDDILDESLEVWHRILQNEYETNEAFRRIANSQLEYASHVVVAKRILEPNRYALADVYWAPGGFVEGADWLDFTWEAPAYYELFAGD